MIEIVLERAEFFVLMDALHAPAIVGMDLARLLPTTHDERQAVYTQGQKLLARRGLLRHAEDGVCRIDGTLLLMAAAVAFPQLASITTRKDCNGHEQIWMHSYSDGLVVEHTLPDQHHHRLMTLPGPSSLTTRLLSLWPAPEHSDSDILSILPSATLGEAMRLIDSHQFDTANQLLDRFDMPVRARVRLINTLHTKTMSGSIALLRCQGEKITAARNPGLIVGSRTTWLATQALPGSLSLRLECVDKPRLQRQIASWMQELYPLQSAA